MNKYKIHENNIELESVPKKKKKLTGTRFATALGLNAWSTPFEVWCACTRTYEAPFEDTIYTIAGKIIEPKIINYLKQVYFMDIQSPEEIYGKDYFRKTWGDFFPEYEIFGGMWDAIGEKEKLIVEIKTTKRAEDWEDDIPPYYKLQAALYSYLKGYDDVIVPVAFLEPEDYEHPENFEPSVSNIKVYEFKLSEEYPNFKQDFILPATEFWNEHVLTGISPAFDEKKDAEILKALRTNTVAIEDAKPGQTDLQSILKEYDTVKSKIDAAELKMAPHKTRLKEIEEALKEFMITQFRDGDKKVEMASKKYTLTLTKSIRNTFDSKSFKEAEPDLYDEYLKQSESYTLKQAEIQ